MAFGGLPNGRASGTISALGFETPGKGARTMRFRHLSTATILFFGVVLAGFFWQSSAQRRTATNGARAATDGSAVDDLAPSEMRPVLERYVVDRGSLQRSYPVASSPARRERFRKFY